MCRGQEVPDTHQEGREQFHMRHARPSSCKLEETSWRLEHEWGVAQEEPHCLEFSLKTKSWFLETGTSGR